MSTEGPQIAVDGETRPYEYVPFPKVLYSESGEARTVGSEREMKALGKGWSEVPPAPRVTLT